jgi:hypothetical protein
MSSLRFLTPPPLPTSVARAAHGEAGSEEMMKLWKSLFYCVWYADKVPVQQDLIANTAALARAGPTPAAQHAFLVAAFDTLAREWMGIDQHRRDKFLSLLRRITHEAFAAVARAGWSEGAVAAFHALLYHHALAPTICNGVRFHVLDVWLDELGAALPDVTTDQLRQLLVPVYAHALQTGDRFMFHAVFQDVLQALAVRISAAALAPAAAKAGGGVEGTIAAAGADLIAALHHTVDSTVIARATATADLGTPLLVDGHQRAAALKRAYRKVSLAGVAQDVFAIAAHA